MTSRECPRCWEELEPTKVDVPGPDVTVDACPSCEGEFLDEGELLRLTGDVDLHQLLTEHLGVDSDSDLVCPACGGVMDAEYVEGAEGDQVEVDVCLSCHGIWLDADERAALRASTGDHGDLNDEKAAEVHDAGGPGSGRIVAAVKGLVRSFRGT